MVLLWPPKLGRTGPLMVNSFLKGRVLSQTALVSRVSAKY
jgi:hypothetical protein